MHPLVHQSVRWILTGFLLLPALSCRAANVPPSERILILVSLDGFRWDYLQKYRPPNLCKIAAEGVQADKLIPGFPSMTFPNHHTIVTGWRPAHHGVINNHMYDPVLKQEFAFNKPELQGPQWWGGEPIWATAIKQGRRANVLFWPGTGTKMAGLLPTAWKSYDGKFEPGEIVDAGLAWLDQPREQRPALLMLYFHHVDSVGHKHGPDSSELASTINQVDQAIGKLLEGLRRLQLNNAANLVIVSDHGMADISTNRLILLGDLVKPDSVKVDFSGALAGLRPLDGNVDALYASCKKQEHHFRTYREATMPPSYHFEKNPRIPPVLLVADEGWYLVNRPLTEQNLRNFNRATHGYDPASPSMGAVFLGWGPNFKTHTRVKAFENVHLYNLFCAILGLQPSPNDGDNRVARAMLAQ